MKIQIENLKAQMQGRDLNIYQKADALIEFNKLLEYVEELEQLAISRVVGRSGQSQKKTVSWIEVIQEDEDKTVYLDTKQNKLITSYNDDRLDKIGNVVYPEYF